MRSWILMAAVIFAGEGVCSGAGRSKGIDVTEGFSQSYQACITYGERNNRTAIPAAVCNGRELRAQDTQLNRTYKDVMARLPETRRAAVRADERNWIATRDRKCGAMADADLGVECRIDETIRRIGYLRHMR